MTFTDLLGKDAEDLVVLFLLVILTRGLFFITAEDLFFVAPILTAAFIYEASRSLLNRWTALSRSAKTFFIACITLVLFSAGVTCIFSILTALWKFLPGASGTIFYLCFKHSTK